MVREGWDLDDQMTESPGVGRGEGHSGAVPACGHLRWPLGTQKPQGTWKGHLQRGLWRIPFGAAAISPSSLFVQLLQHRDICARTHPPYTHVHMPHLQTCIHIDIVTHMWTHMYTHTQHTLPTHLHTHMHTDAGTYVCTLIHTCTYIYT